MKNKIRILLTSTGFDNKKFQSLFKEHVGKPMDIAKVIFVPTAANDKESREILPLCRQEIVDLGVKDENILEYNLDRPMGPSELVKYDAIYFAGGSARHLMKCINDIGWANTLKRSVKSGLFFIGVSAGSMIATPSVKDGLNFINNPLEPHAEKNVTPDGALPQNGSRVNISDDQAVWILGDRVEVIS